MVKNALIVIFVLFWIVLAINPADRAVWFAENLLVVTLFPVVLWLDRRYGFSDKAFFGLTFFVILHLFGANLTYEDMTYFSWLSDWFGWERNYYDQVIHFLFGLLVFTPFFEIFDHQGYSRRLSYLMAFLFISAIASWYEILEWIALMACGCEPGDSILITQGDEWDTQKDMAYAAVGAFIALLIHSRWSRKTERVGSTEADRAEDQL